MDQQRIRLESERLENGCKTQVREQEGRDKNRKIMIDQKAVVWISVISVITSFLNACDLGRSPKESYSKISSRVKVTKRTGGGQLNGTP